jgi:hypothetical protein
VADGRNSLRCPGDFSMEIALIIAQIGDMDGLGF